MKVVALLDSGQGQAFHEATATTHIKNTRGEFVER